MEDATINAAFNFNFERGNKVKIGATEVFKLAKSILSIAKSKILAIKNGLE